MKMKNEHKAMKLLGRWRSLILRPSKESELKLMPPWFESLTMSGLIQQLLILLLISSPLYAQPAGSPMMSPTADGQITVSVMEQMERGKQPLANQEVMLEVGYDGMPVLHLPKVTDAEGKVIFRFIESNEHYDYTVSTKWKNKEFRTDLLNRKADEKEKTVKLIVGEKAATGPVSFEHAFATKKGAAPAGQEPTPFPEEISLEKKKEFSFDWPQVLGLVGLVAVLIFFFFRPQRGNKQEALLEWQFLNSSAARDILGEDKLNQAKAKTQEKIQKFYS